MNGLEMLLGLEKPGCHPTDSDKKSTLSAEEQGFVEFATKLFRANNYEIFTFGSANVGESCSSSDIDYCILLGPELYKSKDKIKTDILTNLKSKGIKNISFGVVSLDDFKKQDWTEDLPPDSLDLDFWDNLAHRTLQYYMVNTGMHISGEKVIDELKEKITPQMVNPIEGYELFNLSLRDLAQAIGEKNDNKMAKAILKSTYSLHLLSNRGLLKNYGEIVDAAELLFYAPKHKPYLNLVEFAYEAKQGKVKFKWNEADTQKFAIFFNNIGNEILKMSKERNYYSDVNQNDKLKSHFERRIKIYDELISAINNDADSFKPFLNFYAEELVSFLRDDLRASSPELLTRFETFKNQSHDKIEKLLEATLDYHQKDLRGSIDDKIKLLDARIKTTLGKDREAIKDYSSLITSLGVENEIITAEVLRDYSCSLLKCSNTAKADEIIEVSLRKNPLSMKSWRIKRDIDVSLLKKGNEAEYELLFNIFNEREHLQDYFAVAKTGKFEENNPILCKFVNYWELSLYKLFENESSDIYGKATKLLNLYNEQLKSLEDREASYMYNFALLSRLDESLSLLDKLYERWRKSASIVTSAAYDVFDGTCSSYFKFKNRLIEGFVKLESMNSKLCTGHEDAISKLGDSRDIDSYLNAGFTGLADELARRTNKTGFDDKIKKSKGGVEKLKSEFEGSYVEYKKNWDNKKAIFGAFAKDYKDLLKKYTEADPCH